MFASDAKSYQSAACAARREMHASIFAVVSSRNMQTACDQNSSYLSVFYQTRRDVLHYLEVFIQLKEEVIKETTVYKCFNPLVLYKISHKPMTCVKTDRV